MIKVSAEPTIKKLDDGYIVRLSVGGYMFFDTPKTSKKACKIILENIIKNDDK